MILRNKRTGCNITVQQDQSNVYEDWLEHSTVYLSSSEHDFNKFWIFENAYTIRGGKIEWGSYVYIRNATLSGYLTDDLKLSAVPETKFTLEKANLSNFGSIEITSEMAIMTSEQMLA